MKNIATPYLVLFIVLAFPVLAIVAVPAGIVFGTSLLVRGSRMKRQRVVFIDYQRDQERYKAVRGLA